MEMQNVWPTILAALPSIILSVAGIVVGLIRWHVEKKTDRNAKRAEVLKEKLRCFYYPYLLFERQNTRLYDLFAQKEKDIDKSFRALTYLINGHIDELSNNDKNILGSIVKNDIELCDLINRNGRYVDSVALREELSKVAVHYKLMELAYYGMIQAQDDPGVFYDYVYPHDIQKRIEDETARIEKEIVKLKPSSNG